VKEIGPLGEGQDSRADRKKKKILSVPKWGRSGEKRRGVQLPLQGGKKHLLSTKKRDASQGSVNQSRGKERKSFKRGG